MIKLVIKETVLGISTCNGDDGKTDLISGERVDKDDPQIEAYGALDEAVASVESAYCLTAGEKTRQIIEEVLCGLNKFLSDLVQHSQKEHVFKIDDKELKRIQDLIDDLEGRGTMCQGWATFRKSVAAAALNYARTVLRRAERRVVAVLKTYDCDNKPAVAYLNRLSDLMFLLALQQENDMSDKDKP